jgi:hypothetical protein
MPESAESPPFLSVVPPAFAETRPPLVYQVLRGVEPGNNTPHRYTRSEAYRAEGYACHPFHRPITKLLPGG